MTRKGERKGGGFTRWRAPPSLPLAPGRENGVENVLRLADGGRRLGTVAFLALRRGDEDGIIIAHERVDRRYHRGQALLLLLD